MADPQSHYSFAWALEIDGPAPLRVATTDLMEAAAVTELGAFFTKGIKNGGDVRIVEGLPSLFYGVRHRSTFQLVVSNADGNIDPTVDWRGAPYTLWHYDRNLGTATEDSVGIVTDAQFANGQVVFTFGVDESMLSNLLPAATIDPATSSPFEQSGSAGAPIPVVFGSSVPVTPPNISTDLGGSGSLAALDYAVGFGTDLRVVDVFGDWDASRTGLERFGAWSTAPGTPTFLSSEGDPDIKATQFSVTGNQSARYAAQAPIRFKTTSSGTSYIYSVVKAYHDTVTPHRVEIEDASISSGLSNVELGGDYAVVRNVYTNVTAGLQPVPATGVGITALRLFGQEDTSILCLCDNPTYPSGSGGTLPSVIIRAIITNAAWGCSSRVQYAVDGTSFSAAGVAMTLAGLGGLVQGALGYDGRQVPAEDALDALLLIGRSRLYMNDRNQWAISTDVETLSVADFSFGPGFESGIRIKRVISYGRAPLDRAVRNAVLHWMPLGRVRARASQVQPQAYARYSIKAVSGVGQDRHYYNPFVRDQDAAEKVLQYLAGMLEGADEQLVFTAGPEARDLAPGDVITATSTVDGFSGEWKVVEVAKSLTDVQLSCIRFNADAYATPRGITHSTEPSDTPNTRTPPPPGPNLIGNPDFAPPMRSQLGTEIGAQFNDYTGAGGPSIGGISAAKAAGTYPPRVPHGWWASTNYNSTGRLSEFVVDKSEAVRSRTKSGHYIRMVYDAVLADAPIAPTGGVSFYGDGVFSDDFAVRPDTDHLISFYGDAADGWYVVVYEDDSPDWTGTIVPLIRDTTDTDGNGWERFYGRWRPQSSTKRAIVGICVSAAGTYNLAAVKVEPVTGPARRPSEWNRSHATPSVLRRFETITMDGSSSYSAPLIHAGDYVLGAQVRITDALTFGTAVKWRLGTANDPDVWAREKTDTFTYTDSSDYKDGTVAFFSAVDQDIVLEFLQADNTSGTATGGTVSIVYQYTRSAPTTGE